MREFLIAVCVVAMGLTASAQKNYGFGSPGAAGNTPHIDANQAWVGRADFAISVTNTPAFAQSFYLITGIPAATSIAGLPIWVDTNSLLLDANGMLPLATADITGTSSLGAAIPNIPALAGVTIYAQAVVLDFDPNTNLPAVTGGVQIEFTLPPLVAVATSVGGSNDPFYLVDPQTMTLVHQSGNNFSNNAYGMTFTNQGRRLYLTSSITGTVTVMDTSGSGAPPMSTLATFPGHTFEAHADEDTKLLWVLADTTGGNGPRQLVALDIDLASGSYGTQVAATTTLPQSGFLERWTLSPTGKRAAVLQVFGNGLFLVDTDPISPTFLQVISNLFVPGNGFLNNRVGWSPDESQLFVISQALGQVHSELARYDFAAGAWIDHDPNTPLVDNIGPSSNPPVFMGSGGSGLTVSPTEDAVFVSTINGDVARIDFQGTSPTGFVITPAPTGLPQVWDVHINPDGTTLAGPSFSPPQLNFWDAQSMMPVGSVPLPNGSNIYNVRWR
ncbi:MAG: hypothetical protein KDB53_10570 [Planctomycetes bacterium]|nr:hypothetical protein [Planctomycetota bacterium]